MSRVILLLNIAFVGCLLQFATDIYAPSLPAIALDLSTTINLSQLSMAIYLWGVSVSILFYGPWSEGVGRRKPLLVGIGIMVFGALICAAAPDIYSLCVGRFILGIGAGGTYLWSTIFRDSFSGDLLARYGSYLLLIITFIIPVAPALGGYLQSLFGWRSSMIFVLIYALFMFLIILCTFKETALSIDRRRLKLAYAFDKYQELFKSPTFVGASFCSFFVYGGQFSWYSAGPVLLIDKLGMLPEKFGLIVFLSAVATMGLGGFMNGLFVMRFGTTVMMRFGWAIIFMSALILMVGYYMQGLSSFYLLTSLILYNFGAIFIFPNAFAVAFSPFGYIAGYAGSLYGFIQITGGAVMGSVVSYVPGDTPVPLIIIMLSISIVSFGIHQYFVLSKT